MKKLVVIIMTVFLMSFLLIALHIKPVSSSDSMDKNEKGEYKRSSVYIYRNTAAWDLAIAVKKQDSSKIEKLAKNNPELLNVRDPKYGIALLLWAIGTEKYESAEVLLKCGANPNLATLRGETPIYIAAGYSWVDREAKKDPKYVKLLLSYGADPNLNYIHGDENDNTTDEGTSPLMNSIGCGIEKTKALVEGGADLNYKTPSGKSAAIYSLSMGGPNRTVEGMEYAKYLIVDKKANISEALSSSGWYPGNILRRWTYKLNSEQYKVKMEIVQECERQGIHYWDYPISKDTIQMAKRVYSETWEEYLQKY